MNDSVLHNLFCALMSLVVYTLITRYQYLHATQPGTFISNVELIFLTNEDAELIRCLYFILRWFRFIVLLYCTV